MDNYKQLALRYLKLNKKRSVVTILGAAITVTILFALLNIGWSAVLHYRSSLRAEQDYEVVFCTETKEQIDAILADDRIKKASIGSYYYYDYYNPVTYDNAVYVNFKNPYTMNKSAKEIKKSLNVSFEYNRPLAITYMQGGEDYLGVIMAAFVLLVSFIFAIFGVGIVRNSIQLSTLEQIKDYGNLRCIGASKGQLKSVIYIEGVILEGIGIGIGLLVGIIVSMIVGHILGFQAYFHILPVIPVLIAFLGDLFFVMEEDCKVVTHMTPVSAIRGEYRIKKEKIKLRKSRLFHKLFGVEGDYAYKNMMRNPGRFFKTTWAIGIGVAAFIAAAGITNTLAQIEKDMEDSFGYYHVYFDGLAITPTQTVDDVRSVVNPELLRAASDLPGVTDAKQVYCGQVFLWDLEDVYTHYTEDYLENIWTGKSLKAVKERMNQDLENTEEEIPILRNCGYIRTLAGIHVYGYDEEDIARYKDVLVDGTTDISENGVMLINHCKTAEEEDDIDNDGIRMIDITYTDYKVGDTIDIVDTEKFRKLYQEEYAVIKREYNDIYREMEVVSYEDAVIEEGKDIITGAGYTEEQLEQYNVFLEERAKLFMKCYKQLLDEGAYKTYTIEGILYDDVNRESSGQPDLIVPLENYYEITGTDESMSIGMQYHFDKFPALKYVTTVGSYVSGMGMNVFGEAISCNISGYPDIKGFMVRIKGYIIGAVCIVLFVVLMSCLNIVNTTASNIYLRKREFAQLRVIGVSKKGLIKMVLLEGVISSILANIIGIVIGIAISYGMFRLVITMLYGYIYRIPWGAMLLSVIVSSLVFCGSIYAPLKGLNSSMADDLKTGGE